MSQLQGIEVRRPSRRTIATGAAWAVPVIAVGAAAPAMASSPNECVPEFTIVPEESFKCCDGGSKKNMKVTFTVTDTSGCVGENGGTVTVYTVALGTGLGTSITVNETVVSGGQVTVFFNEIQSCPANLIVTYSVGTGGTQEAVLKSDNIPSGNDTGDCVAA